jgi:hypothetical protein
MYFGRKPKNAPMATVATIGDNDALSPLTPPVPNINEDLFEESTIDWGDNASIDTAWQEINDERIKLLEAEDNEQEISDGGSYDGEDDEYECAVSFLEGMKDVEIERLCHDANEIEHCVEANDDNAILCDETSQKVSGWIGAPIGWSAPSPPKNWNPTVNLSKGRPPFDEVDNPGGWNSFTFRPIFEKGHYVSHAMPAGATPVPMDNVSGKRQSGGFEFSYNGWKQENPTRENCRFGATKDLLFPPNRQIQLDVEYLKRWD